MLLSDAKRPVIIYGAGIHLAKAEKEAIQYAELANVPVCLTWGAADLLPFDHPLRVGTFGTHGNRFANFAIQNADYILSVGSRLDTKATGSPVSSFAPKAKVVMVDIDQSEIDKFQHLGREVEGICTEARRWLASRFVPVPIPTYADWKARIQVWKEKYPAVRPEWREDTLINPYAFIEKLSDHLQPDDVIVSDTGCVLGWMMQAYKFKGQRFIHAFNNTPMGYGLPASVGAATATGKRIVLVTGDGGLAVNITELATVARHKLPIKIILFNNRGHAMCRQTQRQWLNGEYPATSEEGGLACPDYAHIARAYGLYGVETSWSDSAERLLKVVLDVEGPALLELEVNPDHGIVGQIKFGEPLADLKEAA